MNVKTEQSFVFIDFAVLRDDQHVLLAYHVVDHLLHFVWRLFGSLEASADAAVLDFQTFDQPIHDVSLLDWFHPSFTLIVSHCLDDHLLEPLVLVVGNFDLFRRLILRQSFLLLSRHV
jgi:hypothetical protein